MKTIKRTNLLYVTLIATVLLSAGTTSAQILRVDSVTVDSVWNSDSSWYDGNGILQQRTSRDCKISFIPRGEGMARMFVAISIDNGKTWAPSPNPLVVLNNALATTFMTNQNSTLTARVLGGDKQGVVFKMTARQAAPIIVGNPGAIIVNTFGQNINIVLNLKLASATSTDGFCTLSMVYWDTLGDGIIDDSTAGVNALTWKWLTQLSSSSQTKYVVARARDKNGLWSAPETLKVTSSGLDPTSGQIILSEGFEGDLSNYRTLSFEPGMMSISKQYALSGVGSLTSDSNNTSIKRGIDPLIYDSIAGLKFYLMATKPGQNLMVAMCKSGSSPTGLYTILGIGIDKSDSLRYVYENTPDDTINEHKNIAALTLNKWYECRIEYDFTDTTLTYYVDDTIVRKRPAPSPMALSTFVVLRDSLGAQGLSGCYLDDIIIYKR